MDFRVGGEVHHRPVVFDDGGTLWGNERKMVLFVLYNVTDLRDRRRS
jgi:hypothetical protein